MKLFLSLLTCLSLASFAHSETPPAYTVIEDLAKEPVLTPSLKERQILKIRLSNGLEAVLISDPLTDESAAGITVKTGSFEDGEATPGIAHFNEHMLFLGTKNHPQEAGYQQFVTENGGMANAFTANDFTSYLFSVNNNAFPEALERFSEFFREPLFNPSGVARELQAIDQEYAKNIQNDDIRMIYVLKALANPKHPHHQFGMGNSSTLSNVSRDTLIDWYQKHYSANLMRLIVYSKLPLDTLVEMVVQDFGGIVNNNRAPLAAPSVPIDLAENHSKLFYIEPVKNIRNLALVWNLPEKFADTIETQPETYVCHVLGDEGENSLFAHLKQEHLAEKLGCGSFRVGPGNQVFYLEIELTVEGVKSVDLVIKKVFQAIKGLKNSGIPKYIFDDVQQIAKVKYSYQNRENLFETVMKDVSKLPYENVATFPVHSSIVQKFNPELVLELLNFLTPLNAEMFLVAPSSLTGVKPDTKEKWLGVEYGARALTDAQMKEWKDVLPEPKIGLPAPNHFIPQNLSILNPIDPSKGHEIPVPKGKKIVENDRATIYFAADHFFGTPESYLYFEIKTPKITSGDATSVVLADLYVKAFKDALNKLSYPALVAGLDYDIAKTDNGISIKITGFNDNAEILFKEIVSQLTKLEITEEKFAIFKESLLREYENAYKSSPLKAASDTLKSTIYKHYTTEPEKNEAIGKITFDIFKNSLPQFFKENYIEGIIYGNVQEEKALKISRLILDALPNKSYPKADRQKKEAIILPENQGPFYIEKEVDVQGNAIILLVEQTPFTFKARAAQQILMQALSGPFYSTLRTKQQTGYLVDSAGEEIEKKLFNLFIIQSNTHDPLTLLSRIELFIESYIQEIGESNLTKENFEIIREALIQNLAYSNNNIKAMGDLLKTLAFKYDGDFDFLRKRIQAFHELTYEELLELSKKFFSKANKQRVAFMIDGIVPQDKTLNYKLQTVNELRKLSTYSNGN